MKNQVLFSSRDRSKKLKCHPLQFLCGALRVNQQELRNHIFETLELSMLQSHLFS